MSSLKKQYCQLFQKLQQTNPQLHDAWISSTKIDDTLCVSTIWGQSDLVNNIKSKVYRQHVVLKGSLSSSSIGVPCSWDYQLYAVSPSGSKFATLRKELEDENSGVFTVSIWKSNGDHINTFRTSKEKHGVIYSSERDGGLSWSYDESKLLYIAEKVCKGGKSFWDQSKVDEDTDDSLIGTKYQYPEDWGEQYSNKKTGRIFVADIYSGSISEVGGIPDEVSCAQARFSPDDSGVVFTGWDTQNPYRLGFIYCYNRKCSLYYVNATHASNPAVCINLTPNMDTARAPEFSKNGKYLMFLSTNAVVTHNTCSKLCRLDWESKDIKVLVDVVNEPVVDALMEKSFSGIYTESFPSRCWSQNGNIIYFNTRVGSRVLWKGIDIESGLMIDAKYKNQGNTGCEMILDVFNGNLLVYTTSPERSTSLYLRGESFEHVSTVSYTTISQGNRSPNVRSWSIHTINPCTSSVENPGFSTISDDNSSYESIIVLPEGEMPVDGWPLVVDIHGGPHGHSPANHRVSWDFLCGIGYAVASVNYRGSVGFGVRPLESLVGRVGSQDVSDTHRAIDYFVSGGFSDEECPKELQSQKFDGKNVFCTGGSHGGFISSHLVVQYPSYYRACAVRNPVTNLASQLVTSDIPDWGCAVSGMTKGCSVVSFPKYKQDKEFERSFIQLSDCYEKLLKMSPMGHDLSQVQTPVLFGLGGKDRRVPPTEGLQFYRALRNMKVQTRVCWYPEDCHPLDSVEANSDFVVNMALWWNTYFCNDLST